MGLSGLNQAGAFGSLYSEGVQFGYNFKNAPVTFYAGFDTLKYNSGIGACFRRSTPRPERCPALARMRASKSSRRRISACRSVSVTSSSRGASTAIPNCPRCPTLRSLTSSAAGADRE